jgi:putative colanic acid biosynthesis acetyltransferase WcaF
MVGDGVTIGGGVQLYSVGRIFIGDGAIISQGAHLCGASHDVNSPKFYLLVGDIVIKSNAWVAAEAFIGPGVSIGSNAVVAARAVVMRDVQEGTIVAGNPARQVGLRSSDGINTLKHL